MQTHDPKASSIFFGRVSSKYSTSDLICIAPSCNNFHGYSFPNKKVRAGYASNLLPHYFSLKMISYSLALSDTQNQMVGIRCACVCVCLYYVSCGYQCASGSVSVCMHVRVCEDVWARVSMWGSEVMFINFIYLQLLYLCTRCFPHIYNMQVIRDSDAFFCC